MELLRNTVPYYVRCIKPNDQSNADNIQSLRVCEQLRYRFICVCRICYFFVELIYPHPVHFNNVSGVLQAIQVSRSGYPIRFNFSKFLERYWLIRCAAPQLSFWKRIHNHEFRCTTADKKSGRDLDGTGMNRNNEQVIQA